MREMLIEHATYLALRSFSLVHRLVFLLMRGTAAAHSLRGLLSRPETRERFHQRIAQFEALRTVDAGVPRREESEKRLHRSFRSLRHRLADQGLKFKKGDSAVLVPLIELADDQQPWALFTRRSFHLRSHRGEVSFPGGRIDEGESPEQVRSFFLHALLPLVSDRPPRSTRRNRAARGRREHLGANAPASHSPQSKHRDANCCNGRRRSAHSFDHWDGRSPINLHCEFSRFYSSHSHCFQSPLYALSKSEAYTAFRVGAHLYRMPIFHPHDFRLLMTAENTPESALHVDRIWGLSAGILSETLSVLLEDGAKDE